MDNLVHLVILVRLQNVLYRNIHKGIVLSRICYVFIFKKVFKPVPTFCNSKNYEELHRSLQFQFFESENPNVSEI